MYARNWSVLSFVQGVRHQEDQKFKQNVLQCRWVMVHPYFSVLLTFLHYMIQFAVLLGNP